MKKVEEWRDIEGYEGIYQVSSQGNVKSLDRYVECSNGQVRHLKGHNVSKDIIRNGYAMANLYKNNEGKRELVHRLVAKAFLPNNLNLEQVNHINHNRSDNRVENLEWCTRDYNMYDMSVHKYGEYKDSRNKLGANKCIDCGKSVKYPAKRCRSCARKHIATYSMGRPLNKEEVENSLIENVGNFTKSAKEFNMTDNALRKWCRKYDLPTHSRDWRK